MASDNRWLTSLKLELAYFSGRVWWSGKERGGAGAILRFQRVRPRRHGSFQPLRADEITPRFLDRTIRALQRWNYDIVGLDEACRRAVIMPQPRRFVCLSFDGAYKDLITFAYPVLSRRRVPFIVYVPTACVDGVGEPWWLALEEIIGRERRLSLVVEGDERHFTIRTSGEKHELYAFLSGWMRSLPPPELSAAINDLCRRYSVDLARLTRDAFMDWTDLARLAADPNVTIGSATVNHPVLSNLKDADALREMTMGRAVAETALRREIRHFAYPFGDRASWRRAHVLMTEQAGFASAVSSIPGIVEAEGRTNLHALPRVGWDGRGHSLRAMRVLLSGVAFAPVQPTRSI
ncbi:polysaccharide deacetylase family protein [Bradyrhizobium sp. STM 3562]|uniref:polysaccharide deacetylase family protein n=1 Tax=Bradyrhizobium sp. STM 3562 TaxID=578924 RepID=UPI00388D975E